MSKRGLSKQARGGAAGRKRRPVTMQPDPWANRPATAAQRAGTVVEAVTWTDPDTGERKNPNGVKVIRREPLLERMRKAGDFTEQQFRAGCIIRDAFEATQVQPPAINPVQVDSSPDPAGVVAMQTDRQSHLSAVMKPVPMTASGVVVHVCCEGRPLSAFPGCSGGTGHARAKAALCLALEAVAERFGI